MVPFSEGFVREHKRVFARRAGAVIPESAGPLVGAHAPFATFFGPIPDLHLRRGPQINPAVSFGNGLVIDQEFNVAVIFLGGGVVPVAVVD